VVELRSLRILIVCNYYYPYRSGLSYVAKVLAEELAAEGLEVSVLCHKHDSSLPAVEIVNQVSIHRAKPLFKLNRATFSFDFFLKYLMLRNKQDFVNLHLPMPEAGFLRIKKNQSLLTTYHCDVPRDTLKMKLISFLMDISSLITIRGSTGVIFSSLDYMESSRMKRFASSKSFEVFPFVNFFEGVTPLFENKKGRNFGYLGRFTSEKGALFLIRSFQNSALQDDRLLLAGSSKVAGDSVFEQVLLAAKNDLRIQLYPDIEDNDLPGFYASLNAFCFPSLNSFEAFGIAQVEAILMGIPVLTSNLPGVRVPVTLTGMGQILTVGKSQEWEQAIREFDRNSYPVNLSHDQRKLFYKTTAIEKYLKFMGN
jgi:glycosyltransferase involved in cell wall biosynthesis